MMMNIRGLVLDDPGHSVHLQTLRFAPRDNLRDDTDTEIDIEETVLRLGP